MRIWDQKRRELDDRPIKTWIWKAFYDGVQVAEAEHLCRGKDPFMATVDDARATMKHLQKTVEALQNVYLYQIAVRDNHQNSWAGYLVDLRESGPTVWHQSSRGIGGSGGQRK